MKKQQMDRLLLIKAWKQKDINLTHKLLAILCLLRCTMTLLQGPKDPVLPNLTYTLTQSNFYLKFHSDFHAHVFSQDIYETWTHYY